MKNWRSVKDVNLHLRPRRSIPIFLKFGHGGIFFLHSQQFFELTSKLKAAITLSFFVCLASALWTEKSLATPLQSDPEAIRENGLVSSVDIYLGQATRPEQCDDMSVWDFGMGMCMPLAMPGMPMQMLMLHGNGFAVQGFEEGPRGRSEFAAPHMLMLDVGSSVGDIHYLNLDIMATAELWTIPKKGYPELLQIGESQSNGQPFLDAQHPHNSPIMGLTLSDTIRLSTDSKNHLKIFFAPRGESGDGPVAFMHRTTALANPDAPLGHHIAQDVGHISSTVIGSSLKWNEYRYEFSAFYGAEPEPTKVDVNMGVPNSYSLRLIKQQSPSSWFMGSVAYLSHPESHPDQGQEVPYEMRFSVSAYTEHALSLDWKLHTSTILGLITHYDHANRLWSAGEEFLLRNQRSRFFGRFEILQRTANQLGLSTSRDPDAGQTVGAISLGFSRALYQTPELEVALGSSASVDFINDSFSASYGGAHPWSGKLFVQVGGMAMSP